MRVIVFLSFVAALCYLMEIAVFPTIRQSWGAFLLRLPLFFLALWILIGATAILADEPSTIPGTGIVPIDWILLLGALYAVVQGIAQVVMLIVPKGSKAWAIAKALVAGKPRPPSAS
jgi:hypothetical protein